MKLRSIIILIRYILIIKTLILVTLSYTKILFRIRTVFIILSYITSGKGFIRSIVIITQRRGFYFILTPVFIYITFLI